MNITTDLNVGDDAWFVTDSTGILRLNLADSSKSGYLSKRKPQKGIVNSIYITVEKGKMSVFYGSDDVFSWFNRMKAFSTEQACLDYLSEEDKDVKNID